MNSGKTLYMTYLLFLEWQKGATIISNYHLNFPHVYLENRDAFVSLAKEGAVLENVALGLDELWIWLDCRNSMQEESKVASYMFLQSSKDDTKIFLTAQDNSQNEKRLKDNMHKMSICSRMILEGNTFKTISNEHRFLTEEYQKKLYIRAKTYIKRNYYIMSDWFPSKTKIYLKADRFFKLYDTRQKIKLVNTN